MTPGLAALWLAAARAETVRLGLFVGSDVGLVDEVELVYAEDEAREVGRVFAELGGFDRDRVTVVQGPEVGEVRAAMATIDATLRGLDAEDDALLVFFYAGHAARDGLHLSGGVLPFDEVRGWLERSRAQVRVAFVDACESGALARGGAPAPEVDVVLDDALTARGVAILASTGATAVARESAAFGGGVFTQALLAGLRGGADGDGDGVVTLDEVYRHAFEATVVGTALGAGGVQRPEFRYAIAGVGHVPLTRVGGDTAAIVLPEEAHGAYAVVSVASGRVVVRVDKAAGDARRIALPAGRYVVRKLRDADVLVGEVDLVWGGDREVHDAALDAVTLDHPAARGRPGAGSAVGIAAVAGPAPVPGHPAQLGGSAQLRAGAGPVALAAEVAGTGGRRQGPSGDTVVRQARASVGVVGVRRLARLDGVVGGGVAAIGVWQWVRWTELGYGGEQRESVALQQLAPAVWGGAELRVPLAVGLGLDLGVRAHLARIAVDRGAGLYVQGEARAGASFVF